MRSRPVRHPSLTKLQASDDRTRHPLDETDSSGGRSSEFLEFAQAAGGFGVFELNLVTGQIQGTSLFFELIGLECRDMSLSREQWLATVHPEDLQSVVDALSTAVASGGGYQLEYRTLLGSGVIRWLAGRGQILLASEGHDSRAIGTITDVTERKHLEDKLLYATESLNIAQAAAGVATFDFDFKRDGRICSDNFRELLGIPAHTNLQNLNEVLAQVHPDDFARVRSAPLATTPQEPSYRCEYRVRLEGRERWIAEKARVTHDKSGQIERIAGALVDITDLKHIKAALGSTENRLERALRGMKDGLWEIDLIANTCWYGLHFYELLGYTAEELTNSRERYWALIHPEDRAQVDQNLAAHLEHGAEFDIEYRIQHKAGHYEWIRTHGQAERAADGTPVRLAGAMQVITDRKRAEQATIEAKLAAEAANRAKSSFLANLSHEIRTPMNGVIGMAQMLAETPLDGTQREYLHIIKSSANALLSLINDVLDLSKIEADRLELENVEFDLIHLMYESAAATALSSAAKGIEMLVTVEPSVPVMVSADPGRVRQIILNLLGNAVKFTHEGHILLRARAAPAPEDHIDLTLEISDTGIGIPPDKLDRLFKSFSQVDASTTRYYGGTGLGLSIVKRLAQLMGGEVGVYSEAGQGSTFWVRLRVRNAMSQPVRDRMGKGRRILIVDDLAVSRESLSIKLEKFGFATAAVKGVDEALTLLLENPAFDLVVADEHMPTRGGMDLLTALRNDTRFPRLPFVLLSLFGAEHDTATRDYRPDAIGLKPISASALATLVDQVLSGSTPDAAMFNAPASVAPTFPGSRILLVEDNPVNQRVAQRALQKLAAEVTVANNGAEALERIATIAFDAVLMDCQMPVMDGFTACRRIRELERAGNLKRMPIIALTANVMSEDRELCIAAGMDAHLGKPIEPKQLVDTLNRYLKPVARSDALDREALQTLTGGDAQFERELAHTFISSGDRCLADIIAALRVEDFETVRKRAHALKGASANIHAAGLAKIASSLERAAASPSVPPLGNLVAELTERLAAVNAELRKVG